VRAVRHWKCGHREQCGKPPPPLLPPDSSDDEDFPKANRKKPEAFDLSPRKTSRGYLKIHPSDNCKGLPPLFLSDPTAFRPVKEENEPDVLRWGLPADELPVTQEWMARKLQTGLTLYGEADTVEVQFVKVLAKKKRRLLDERARETDAALDSVITLRAAVRVDPPPWRQLRVRASSTLADLAAF
jgi:hypothetical protein